MTPKLDISNRWRWKMKKTSPKRTIIFICEHGAAKSVIAAAYFNKLAGEMKLNVNAVARGTYPDQELSPKAVEGLLKDGLNPTESAPQKLLPGDLNIAQRIITFCDLPEEYLEIMEFELWKDVPPVSENYQNARDVILGYLNRLMTEIK
jgi:protein-tyrosine-phosphatase